MFLDQAEFRATRLQDIRMRDWTTSIDKFLRDNELAVLSDTGSVAHEDAETWAAEQEEIEVTGRGSAQARADFIVWRTPQDKTGQKSALIVVETKARGAQAIAIYPDSEPDPRIFNPGMRQVFQDATHRLGRRPQGTLAITSNPSYARVYVDGTFVGVTPMAMDKVIEGRHFIREVAWCSSEISTVVLIKAYLHMHACQSVTLIACVSVESIESGFEQGLVDLASDLTSELSLRFEFAI